MFLNSLLADKPVWYPVLFDSPLNIARGIAFWLTLILAIGFVLGALLLKGPQRKKFLRYASISAIAYACAVALLFLIWTFVDDGIVTMLFVPILILIVAIAGSAVTLFFNRSKTVVTVLACTVGAAAVATLVCLGVFYARNIAGDGYYNSEVASVNQIVLYISAAALIVVIVALGFLLGTGDKKGFDSKSIAYAGICIAMSFALSYVRFFKLPQGGSVTLASLLPLMIYSCMFGTRKGVFAGLIYGILQAVQDPYIIHPAQFLLDYPIAFAAIGLAGAFFNVKKLDRLPQVQFALGAIVASALRYLSHVLSGVFAFSAYAADAEMGAWIYSLAYNSFVFADIAIAIVVGILVFSSKSFVKEVKKVRPAEKKEEPAEEE